MNMNSMTTTTLYRPVATHNTHNTHATCTYIGTGSGCTSTVLRGRSYCTEHYYQVYKAGSSVQRRRDELQAARVRAVEQLMHEAIEELTAEGYDLYSGEPMAEVDLEPGDDTIQTEHSWQLSD